MWVSDGFLRGQTLALAMLFKKGVRATTGVGLCLTPCSKERGRWSQAPLLRQEEKGEGEERVRRGREEG